MQEAENIRKSLIEKFNLPDDSINIHSERRVTLTIFYNDFPPIFDYLYNELGFKIIMTITGLDEIDKYTIIYHISNNYRLVLNLKAYVPKDKPEINSVIKYFPGAELYEREIADLLGIKVHGLPPGRRYPLPEGWPDNEYPLRKDWHSPENTQKEDD